VFHNDQIFMLILRKYLLVIIELSLVVIALGGLLFACSNQEISRQKRERFQALRQEVVFQAPADELLNPNNPQWRKPTQGEEAEGPYKGLLIDVRYWSQNADNVIDSMANAGYHVEYINPQAQRLAVWVASAEQLAALTNIEGVTAISLNTAIPKR
jgi:hypothetical protein